MSEVHVRVLRDDDDRSAFESGDADLDRFFRKYAGQNQFRHHIGVTYVADDGSSIVGFVTLTAGDIEIERLPERSRKKLPAYPLPILRIARLASSRQARSLGVGRLLLRFSLEMALDMAGQLGCVGVVVDAKEEAVAFYERYGFEPFEVLQGGSDARPAPVAMFLPLGSIPERPA